MADAFIYDAIRSPRGKGRPDGSLHEVTAVRLSAEILNALKSRNNLDTKAIEDVIWGNVTQVAEQGGCLARSAVLASDFDEAVPGLAINRFCASGLEAVNLAANQVKGGAGNAYVAGGGRDDGPCSHGLGRSRDCRGPDIGYGHLFCATGDIGGHHRHRVWLLAR